MRDEQFCVLTTTESRAKISASKMHLKLSPPPPPLAYTAVRSKAVFLLFNVLPIICGSSVFVFVLLSITLCLF